MKPNLHDHTLAGPDNPHCSPPAPLVLLDSILSGLASLSASKDFAQTPAHHVPLPDAARPLLLTLHVLFPRCLLDALDLLDRGCVTRLVKRADSVEQNDPLNAQTVEGIPARRAESPAVGYAVHSSSISLAAAQHQHPRPHGSEPVVLTAAHRVLLDSWSCSCPGFAFAAYGTISRLLNVQTSKLDARIGQRTWKLCFGGRSLGTPDEGALPAVCKHLLACVLADACPAFFAAGEDGKGVKERSVGKDEFAGWVGGAEL